MQLSVLFLFNHCSNTCVRNCDVERTMRQPNRSFNPIRKGFHDSRTNQKSVDKDALFVLCDVMGKPIGKVQVAECVSMKLKFQYPNW